MSESQKSPGHWLFRALVLVLIILLVYTRAEISALERYHHFQQTEREGILAKVRDVSNLHNKATRTMIAGYKADNLDTAILRTDIENVRAQIKKQQERYNKLVDHLQSNNYQIPLEFLNKEE